MTWRTFQLSTSPSKAKFRLLRCKSIVARQWNRNRRKYSTCRHRLSSGPSLIRLVSRRSIIIAELVINKTSSEVYQKNNRECHTWAHHTAATTAKASWSRKSSTKNTAWWAIGARPTSLALVGRRGAAPQPTCKVWAGTLHKRWLASIRSTSTQETCK